MTTTLLSALLLSILLTPFLSIFVAGSFGLSLPDRLKHMGLALLPFIPSNVYQDAYRSLVTELSPRMKGGGLKELEAFETEYDNSTRYELVILFTPLIEMGANTIVAAVLTVGAFGFFAYKQFFEGVYIAPSAFFIAFWFWWPSIIRTGHLMTMPLCRTLAGTSMRGSFVGVVFFRLFLEFIVLVFSFLAGALVSVLLVPAATLSMAVKSYRRLKVLRDACATFQGT